VEAIETTLQVDEAPIADTQRYDSLREVNAPVRLDLSTATPSNGWPVSRRVSKTVDDDAGLIEVNDLLKSGQTEVSNSLPR
jgi:hypothetical protein